MNPLTCLSMAASKCQVMRMGDDEVGGRRHHRAWDTDFFFSFSFYHGGRVDTPCHASFSCATQRSDRSTHSAPHGECVTTHDVITVLLTLSPRLYFSSATYLFPTWKFELFIPLASFAHPHPHLPSDNGPFVLCISECCFVFVFVQCFCFLDSIDDRG